jgi:hypothetical protein
MAKNINSEIASARDGVLRWCQGSFHSNVGYPYVSSRRNQHNNLQQLTKNETISSLQQYLSDIKEGKVVPISLMSSAKAMISVAKNMKPSEFPCVDSSYKLVNICNEVLKEDDFYDQMLHKCIEANGRYLMCKFSESRICEGEMRSSDKFKYVEPDTTYSTKSASEGDVCAPTGQQSDNCGSAQAILGEF